MTSLRTNKFKNKTLKMRNMNNMNDLCNALDVIIAI